MSRRRPRRRFGKTRERKDARRRAIYVWPNLVTTASLFAGFFAIISALELNYLYAAFAVLASLVFDGLDGRLARATGATSRFGVEYDSLSDLVAFGVAPSVMLYQWALAPLGRLGFAAAFLFTACGALRLARFNVQTEKVGSKHFVGLPIPAAASMVATCIMVWAEFGSPDPINPWVILALSFILSFLMVSNIPYLSLKEMGIAKLRSFNGLVAALLFCIMVAIEPQVMGFVIMAAYVAGGPLGARLLSKKAAAREEAHEAETETESKTDLTLL